MQIISPAHASCDIALHAHLVEIYACTLSKLHKTFVGGAGHIAHEKMMSHELVALYIGVVVS